MTESESASNENALARAGETYTDRPLYRALFDIAAQVVGFAAEASGYFPGASLAVPVAAKTADTAVAESVRVFRTKRDAHRVTVLNETIAEELGDVQPESIADDAAFLHCFEATLRVTLRTYRDEKIRLFGRLLASTMKGEAVADVDEYEELLDTLVDLAGHELYILTALERMERRHNFPDAIALGGPWNEFIAEIAESGRVRSDEIPELLTRLNRTGLYANYTDSFNGYDGMGHLTRRYYRLRDLIAGAEGNVMVPASA